MDALPDNLELKTAYAVAYAGFRAARAIASPSFREELESRALKVFLAVLNGEENKSAKLEAVRNMEYLLAFGRDVGLLHPGTVELILAESDKLKSLPAGRQAANPSAIRQSGTGVESGNPAITKPIAPSELFPKMRKPASNSKQNNAAINNPAKEIQASAVSDSVKANDPVSATEEYAIRRSRIIDRIRQSGNCRIKDMEGLLGGFSERTLRYDLQRMVQEGIVERVGPGGPATYYRLRDSQ